MKILMVCLGNICRSPLAEGIMQNMAREKNLDLLIDSAGTSAWHEGERPDRRSIAVAQKNGINISNLRSRPLHRSDFDEFDYLFAMDLQNLDDLKTMAETDHHLKKIHLFLEFAEMKVKEVPDPYYTTENGFEYVYQLLNDACEKTIQKLQVNNRINKTIQ